MDTCDKDLEYCKRGCCGNLTVHCCIEDGCYGVSGYCADGKFIRYNEYGISAAFIPISFILFIATILLIIHFICGRYCHEEKCKWLGLGEERNRRTYENEQDQSTQRRANRPENIPGVTVRPVNQPLQQTLVNISLHHMYTDSSWSLADDNFSDSFDNYNAQHIATNGYVSGRSNIRSLTNDDVVFIVDEHNDDYIETNIYSNGYVLGRTIDGDILLPSYHEATKNDPPCYREAHKYQIRKDTRYSTQELLY